MSWCKFEITVDSSKDIRVSSSSKNVVEIPPVIVTAINLKTIVNEKQDVNEIVSASVISCHKAKVCLRDTYLFCLSKCVTWVIVFLFFWVSNLADVIIDVG